MIYEVHRKPNNNVGDVFCNPSRYFDLGECSSEELLGNSSPITDNTLVVGGGGLIHKRFSKEIQKLINKNPKHTVLWGIGHNFGVRHVQKQNGDVYYPDWLGQCSLVGIRDWIKDHYNTYLPCVSCMHSAFDKEYKIRHDVVYFTHAFKSKFENTNTFPHMANNNMSFEDVIGFLGSANTVVTDSYHGAYWAQLLGKNVQVVSWSVKFDHFKYPLHNIANGINSDYKFVKNSRDDILDEARYLNKEFYQKFLNLTT